MQAMLEMEEVWNSGLAAAEEDRLVPIIKSLDFKYDSTRRGSTMMKFFSVCPSKTMEAQ